MAGETTLTLIGNLTADPELRDANGTAVANFTIASTPRTFDKNSNDWKDGDTLFMRCNVWRELATNAAAQLYKGARVMAQGNLRQRSYDKDGVKVTVMELEVQEIGLLVPRNKPNNQRAGLDSGAVAPGLQQPMSSGSYGGEALAGGGYDPDVPF